jgi:pimeloyl-ACP methyl ester carboxylesterase
MKWLQRALVAWRLWGPVLPPRWKESQQHPWRVPARTMFVGDRELSIREAGPADGPVLVLIHGLGGSSMAEWYKVAPLLAERFRLMMIDHRGSGHSASDRGRFEINEEADDIAAILDALELEEVGVVGYSMGGTIAQTLAHRHPGLVRRLGLIGSMAFHPRGWKQGRAIGAIVTRAWERLTGTGTPEVRTGYLLAVGAVAPEHARWLWQETHRRDPEAGAEASLALFRFDSRPWLDQITVPTLVVIPTRDQLVPPRWQYDLAARIKGSTVVEIPDGRHELPWSHAELLAKELGEFFGG